MVAGVVAPENYDQFAAEWSGYVLGFVRKLGVPWQEANDVAQDILVALISADILAEFNPGHAEVHEGKVYTTKFKAFLNRHVEVRVRGQRDKLKRRRQREALIMDQPLAGDTQSTWADLLLGTVDDVSIVEAGAVEDVVARFRRVLERTPRRSSRDLCDLPVVFDMVMVGVVETGAVDYELIRQKFGISATAARAWVKRMCSVLATALEEAK